MRVAVLGSGSRGNAIALSAGGMSLLIDAGFGIRSLARRARAAGVDLRSLVAVILTHEHGDHTRGAVAVANYARCPIYGSAGTLAVLRPAVERGTVAIQSAYVPIGPFVVACCRTSHDAAEPLALAVQDAASGRRVGIAYDLGHASATVRGLLRNCACLIVEANHDDALLRDGPYPLAVQRRIAGSRGHLSNLGAAALIEAVFHTGLETVVLAHLSDRCNRPRLAHLAAAKALERRGYRGTLFVADQDRPLRTIDLAGESQLSLEGL